MDNNINTDDLRIVAQHEVATPAQIHDELTITESAAKTTLDSRQAIHNILQKEDDRLLVIIGPCSVHDPDAAIDYAKRLKPLIEQLKDDLHIVMRVYFEKPRTTVGWKGLINDPDLDESYNIDKGLRVARKLLLDLNEMGLSTATEYLDLISPQYVSDLIAWGAIGARTTESQGHRELASGLSCPVGFKNGTDGTISIAIDAIGSATRPHHFMSLTKSGKSAIFTTTGNEDCHIILRGGKQPNYDAVSVNEAATALKNAGIIDSLMIDFSHANSLKQHKRQLLVGTDVAEQISNGDDRITGVMIESNIVAGNQKVIPGEPLTYGQSITDACIDWEDSEAILSQLAEAVKARRTVNG
jgi:3-deoxy-7-phosphoheptulonate synthase